MGSIQHDRSASRHRRAGASRSNCIWNRARVVAAAALVASGCVYTRQNWDTPLPPSRIAVVLHGGAEASGDLLAVADDALLVGTPAGRRCIFFDEVRAATISVPRPPKQKVAQVPLGMCGAIPVVIDDGVQPDAAGEVDVAKLKALEPYAAWKKVPVPCSRPDGGEISPGAPAPVPL